MLLFHLTMLVTIFSICVFSDKFIRGCLPLKDSSGNNRTLATEERCSTNDLRQKINKDKLASLLGYFCWG
jgi:hypothetical protein